MEDFAVEQITKLIEAVKSVAPLVWGMAIKQVYVVMTTDIIWGSVFGISAIVVGTSLKRHWEKWVYDEWPAFLAWFAIIIGILVFLMNLTYVVGYAINPEWHALKLLIGMPKMFFGSGG